MPDTIKSLRAEIDRLTAELTELRAWRDGHVCVPAAPVTPHCICATSGTYCPVHTPSNTTIRWYQNTAGAAGCAGANYTLTMPAAGNPQYFQIPSSACIGGAAGGAASYIQTYAVGGECA